MTLNKTTAFFRHLLPVALVGALATLPGCMMDDLGPDETELGDPSIEESADGESLWSSAEVALDDEELMSLDELVVDGDAGDVGFIAASCGAIRKTTGCATLSFVKSMLRPKCDPVQLQIVSYGGDCGGGRITYAYYRCCTY